MPTLPTEAARPAHDQDSLLANAPLRIGEAALVVRDLGRMVEFYRSALGLSVLDQDRRGARLGAGLHPLLTLLHKPAASPRDPFEAGLYHTAFLLPSRDALAAWMVHISALRVRISGAADHLACESIYLADPEGNGIEMSADRPSASWWRIGGVVQGANDPMDLAALMRIAEGRHWSGMPANSVLGHLHLQVGDATCADRFYVDRLGFKQDAPLQNASFYSSGGYHHQLAVNHWNSRGAGLRREDTTGLAWFTLVVRDKAELEAIRNRCEQAGDVVTPFEAAVVVRDPWRTAICLVSDADGSGSASALRNALGDARR